MTTKSERLVGTLVWLKVDFISSPIKITVDAVESNGLWCQSAADETETPEADNNRSPGSALAKASTSFSNVPSGSMSAGLTGGNVIEPSLLAVERSHSETVAGHQGEDAGLTQPLRFPAQEVIARVAVFLKHAVRSSYWTALLNMASLICRNWTPLPESRRLPRELEQVLLASQPLGTFTPGSDELHYLALWSVHFLFQCGTDLQTCIEFLRRGMKLEAQRRSAVAQGVYFPRYISHARAFHFGTVHPLLYRSGAHAPYLMQREGGLSLGATSPTLPKLVKLGLVQRLTEKTPTNRPRHEYSLTNEGKQQAKRGWKAHLDSSAPPADLDALLRLVELATNNGALAAQVADLVKRAAKSRANLSERCSLEASQVDSSMGCSMHGVT
jgi:DNA-binding PadR family transcriptional regulator